MSFNIGIELQKARLNQKISLEDAVKATHIRLSYLQLIEENQLEKLPSLTQARGFIRLYCDFLGINSIELLGQLEQEVKIKPQPPEEKPVSKKDKKNNDLVQTLPVEKPSTSNLSESPQVEDPALPYFEKVGQLLKEQREKLSLALEDIAGHTKIRQKYLEALELGKFDVLPSTMQTRGLLSNYAGFLSLDLDPILYLYADGLQSRRDVLAGQDIEKKSKKDEVKKPRLTGIRQFLTPDLIIGVFLIIVLFGFIIWGAGQLLNSKSLAITPSAPPISEVLLATPSVSSSSIEKTELTNPIESTETGEIVQQTGEINLTISPTVIIAKSSSLQINIAVNQPAFLRIISDGLQIFNGRVSAGNAYQYNGNSNIELLTGNAAALEITFNQTNLGKMGNFGEELHIIFSANGIQTPTPAFTRTPTATPLATLTPRPTPTVITPTVTPLIPTP